MNDLYLPPPDIKSQAWVSSFDEYQALYKKSIESPNEFWQSYAKEFIWKQEPKFNANWNFDINKGPIHIRWFDGGLTNLSYNLLDYNIQKGKGENIAFIWVPNDIEEEDKHITYNQLWREVCQFSRILLAKGVKKGDRICLYMPMIFELPIAMLACARIGAIHSVIGTNDTLGLSYLISDSDSKCGNLSLSNYPIQFYDSKSFAGFSAQALADRILDAGARILITADGYFRGQKLINLKHIVNDAIQITTRSGFDVECCIVVGHVTPKSSLSNGPELNGSDPEHKSMDGETNHHKTPMRPCKNFKMVWNDRIDCWWHEETRRINDNSYLEPEWIDSEDPIFMLYTSGSTGTPKGVLHTCAGYMMYVATTFKYVFDYHQGDVYFCSGDIGWITGHSYVVYGPLANGATSIIFEGIPTYPHPDRYWSIIQKYKVSKFYTSPTAIRALMKHGSQIVKKHDLSSLRILGSVGEPINPEAWVWYYEVVGNKRCAIVDTYWQTETGGHVLTPLPGAIPTKPGSATFPFFGVEPVILDEEGKEITDCKEGYLCFKKPWPGIMRTIYNCQERFEKGYFYKFPGYYTTGDGAFKDSDGYLWITGRIDDMMNVSGHLLSTASVESALILNEAVIEAAVVAIPHPLKGQCLYCFVTLKDGFTFDNKLKTELIETVAQKIGRFAVPDYIQNAPALPKTRSGKIMRRILRKIAEHDNDLGDISTLADESVIDALTKYRVKLV